MTATSPDVRLTAPIARAPDREQWLEAMFQAHYARVAQLVSRVVGDRAEAEALTLEAFWQLWQRPPADDRNVGGWLYRVALRLGLNALRAARRRANYEIAAGRWALENTPPPDPAQEAERHAERARVQAVLAQLPEREAQLLLLRHTGLSYQEVAATLGVAPGSVGTLLARAEAAFAARWATQNEADNESP